MQKYKRSITGSAGTIEITSYGAPGPTTYVMVGGAASGTFKIEVLLEGTTDYRDLGNINCGQADFVVVDGPVKNIRGTKDGPPTIATMTAITYI
jgi:hypothetical protein